MLDPRIYRMGIIPVLLAVIVLGFSLEDQPGGLRTAVAPDAFSGPHAYATMRSLGSKAIWSRAWPRCVGNGTRWQPKYRRLCLSLIL